MGFVRADAELESWLDGNARAWKLLSDKQYATHVAAWKAAFDSCLSQGQRHRYLEGTRALERLQSLLPCSAIVFNLPGYPHLPTPPSPHSKTFAYSAVGLRHVDTDLAESKDLILGGAQLSFTCIFSREGALLGSPWLLES